MSVYIFYCLKIQTENLADLTSIIHPTIINILYRFSNTFPNKNRESFFSVSVRNLLNTSNNQQRTQALLYSSKGVKVTEYKQRSISIKGQSRNYIATTD